MTVFNFVTLQLAAIYHPGCIPSLISHVAYVLADRNKSKDATEKFKEISAAYDALCEAHVSTEEFNDRRERAMEERRRMRYA